MPTFITLLNWTDQGVKNVKDTVKRAEAATDLAHKMNCQMREVHWTIGQYDMVAVIDAPDDETATAFSLSISAQGNVRTHTLRALDIPEMRRILDKMR
jgi:uncharacterized protein with GYD domain